MEADEVRDTFRADRSSAAPITAGASGDGTLVRRPGLLVGAAGFFAVLASSCCIGPLVLTVFGMSALGASTVFAPLRPLFLGMTALPLGGAFYLTYVRTPASAPGSVCVRPAPKLARLNRTLLWVAALCIAAVAMFPSLEALW